MPRKHDLLSEALDLPIKQRARLAQELLRSLDDDAAEDPTEVDQAWTREIGRRLSAVKAGVAKLTEWEDVRRGLGAQLRRLRSPRTSGRRKPSSG
jgi:putative addiction module component (TIGR02574 family)